MANAELNQALENIYSSINNDNEDIDSHITALKACLATAGLKDATFDPARLHTNNRAGRKLMQSYFRKRGVNVLFSS